MAASMSTMSLSKKEGDISDAFVSLSNTSQEPLPDRYRQLKLSLIEGHEDAVVSSWKSLLHRLKIENEEVAGKGSEIIPRVKYQELVDGLDKVRREEIKKRGTVVVEGVVEEDEARGYKTSAEDYIKANPHTKGFPKNDPQVWELYWSPSQTAARSHPNILQTQRLLMQNFWTASPEAEIDLSQPITYADRLRIRQPGDKNFALGPHMDGGSVERWEREGYGDVYKAVFKGDWERGYNAWDSSKRVDAVYDTSDGSVPSGCSAFRMWQGWLSMSSVGPGEGTLLVNPLLALSTVYLLLRPFFRPINEELEGATFLDEGNWEFLGADGMITDLQGATPGHGQELSEKLHPHLELGKTMVSIPKIRPGDYVAWHCDVIHAVDQVHNGTNDSSVLYIPVCPLTTRNASYMRRQLDKFKIGHPGPDFPGGEGEERHAGRPTQETLTREMRKSMGLERFVAESSQRGGVERVVDAANQILGVD